jgi:integrase
MTFSNRNGWLYCRKRGERPKATGLRDTPANRKLFASHCQNDEFYEKFNVKKDIPTVIELCEEVISKLEKTLKRSTIIAYKSVLKSRIVPHFNRFVTEIEPYDIYKWYETFNDRSTLNTAISIIRKAFELAIIKKHIKTTPLVISKPTFKSNYEIKPFTLDEMKRILTSDSPIRDFLGISMFTGLRSGEMYALRWREIDFNEMTIDINNTVSKGVIQPPKTRASRAKIDLPVEALPYFRNQQMKTGMREFVFYNKWGNPIISPSVINHEYKKLLKRLGLEDRGIHQTRHTFASQKLSAGEKLEWVSYMMRHNSPFITQKVYYKYMPRKKEERVLIDLSIPTQNRHTS